METASFNFILGQSFSKKSYSLAKTHPNDDEEWHKATETILIIISFLN